MNQYWWGNINKAAKSAYPAGPMHLKHNAEKRAHTAHFKLPKGPFKSWQMDFIQLHPSQGFKYVLVMVCTSSYWTKALSCRQTTVSSIAKILLEKNYTNVEASLTSQSSRNSSYQVPE